MAAEVLCDMEVSPHVGAVIVLLDLEEAKSLRCKRQQHTVLCFAEETKQLIVVNRAWSF